MIHLQQPVELEVLLPVHNEAATICATIREIYEEFSAEVRMRFIVCEDGSQDGTQAILTRLSSEIPMVLSLSDARKGYSRAVRDGMRALQAPYLLCLDSDGQCDPGDFWKFWDALRHDADVVIGWRVNRADTPLRRSLSRFFYLLYQAMFRVPVHDPSCPYVLARKELIERARAGTGGHARGVLVGVRRARTAAAIRSRNCPCITASGRAERPRFTNTARCRVFSSATSSRCSRFGGKREASVVSWK